MTNSSTSGIRNNNPGNIRRSDDKWQGLAEVQSDSQFFVFTTPVYGVRAIARLLINYQDKYGLRTIHDIISKWAPPVENKTDAYIASVVQRTGFAAAPAVWHRAFASDRLRREVERPRLNPTQSRKGFVLSPVTFV